MNPSHFFARTSFSEPLILKVLVCACNVVDFFVPGPGDLISCYLCVYIGELLRIFQTKKTKAEAKSLMLQTSLSTNFKIPGETGFCFPGFFTAPVERQEAGKLSWLQVMGAFYSILFIE